MNDTTNNTLELLATAYLKEQRLKRFWSILLRCLFLVVLISVILIPLYQSKPKIKNAHGIPHVALLDINGIIQEKELASADNIRKALYHIYRSKGVKGIILRINSPGGSPVQADYIYHEITRMRKIKPDVPVYAVCSDICASAAYYIASAANKIYANQASLVGSIGVIHSNFGFNRLMEKVGIENRIQTAGSRKAILNPFSPLSEADKQHMQTNLNAVHQRFIQCVKAGRGNKLAHDPTIFSGLFWAGEKAKALGLIDDFASAHTVAHEVFKLNKVIDYSPEFNFYEKISKQLSSELKLILTATEPKLW